VRLVGAKYSKAGLVALVNWLLHCAEKENTDEIVAHAAALSTAAEDALSKFGDEYEGRLGPLREAVDAYMKWLLTEHDSPPTGGET